MMNDRVVQSVESTVACAHADSIQIRLKEKLELPLEAEVLSPDRVLGLSNPEICDLPVMMGNRQYRLRDFFEVEGEKSSGLELHGELSPVKGIGRGMTCGTVEIHGNAGMHLGSSMAGGAITVHGNAGDWLGAEMSNGLIHVSGDAGGQTGAAYRGSRKGMRGGVILIDGNAGIEVGMRMRRGLIGILGRVGDFAGVQMLGGTIVLGAAGIRTGAWMSRGTIVALNPIKLLPTFQYACTYEPVFLRLIVEQFRRLNVAFPERELNGAVRRYTGDTSGLGKGEILICDRN